VPHRWRRGNAEEGLHPSHPHCTARLQATQPHLPPARVRRVPHLHPVQKDATKHTWRDAKLLPFRRGRCLGGGRAAALQRRAALAWHAGSACARFNACLYRRYSGAASPPRGALPAAELRRRWKGGTARLALPWFCASTFHSGGRAPLPSPNSVRGVTPARRRHGTFRTIAPPTVYHLFL